MSEDSSTGGTTETLASGDVQEAQNTINANSVSYESHRKLLSEKKKLQTEFETMRSEFETLRDDKLQTEGNKDELIESLKVKSRSAEEKFNKAVNHFADRTIHSALREEAIKAGCINVDDFIKLTDTSLIQVSDDFGVDMNEIKNIVHEAKKSRDYLFSARTPNLKTGTPSNNIDTSPDWKKMTAVEQAKYAFTMKYKK